MASEYHEQPLKTGKWSKDEHELFLSLYETHSYAEIAKILNRPEFSVRNHRYDLRLPRKDEPAWTEAEIEVVREHYAAHDGKSVPVADLAKRLGRTVDSIHLKASRLGLGQRNRTYVERINGRWPSDVPKYATDEERRSALSAGRRQWWQEHPNHRPALGMKHTPETKARISASSKAWNASVTPIERELMLVKANKTKLERYGTGNPSMLGQSNPYTRTRGGKRADLDDRYFRSSWEANYARYLRWLVEQGEIQAWEFEPETFVFHGVTRNPLSYTPDFKVTENDGSVVYHEIKGWMDPASRNRLRRMTKFYPDVQIIVIGEVEYKALAKWSGMIEGWES